jgi:hypothetical protein
LTCRTTLRIEGPPFLSSARTASSAPSRLREGCAVVWRLADGPARAIETKPGFDPSAGSRGADELTVPRWGRLRRSSCFAVTLERRGVRLATADFKLRIGPVIKVRTICRIVENSLGGTRRPEPIRDADQRKELEAGVNVLLRPLGVEVALEEGRAVAAPDGWFDREGRFHPIAMKDGKKANSPTLNELLRKDEKGAINVYFVRDCFWETVQEGFPRIRTDHHLVGVGLKEGKVVLDDAWDVPSFAHELGHALGLDDLKEKSERGRMMYSLRRDRTGEAFTYGEMKDARERARLHLKSWMAAGRACTDPPASPILAPYHVCPNSGRQPGRDRAPHHRACKEMGHRVGRRLLGGPTGTTTT